MPALHGHGSDQEVGEVKTPHPLGEEVRRVFNGIHNGRLYRPYSSAAAAWVVCELYEDSRELKEYQRWQGVLEARWGGPGGPCPFLTLGAYILELDDGSKGLIYTTGWRGGYANPRWTRFLGPGPTAFEGGWLRVRWIADKAERPPPCITLRGASRSHGGTRGSSDR